MQNLGAKLCLDSHGAKEFLQKCQVQTSGQGSKSTLSGCTLTFLKVDVPQMYSHSMAQFEATPVPEWEYPQRLDKPMHINGEASKY